MKTTPHLNPRPAAILVAALGALLLAASPPRSARACDFLEGVAPERQAEILAARERVLDRVRDAYPDAGANDRAEALVHAVFSLKPEFVGPRFDQRASNVPADAELRSVEFPPAPEGEREIRVVIDFSDEFIASREFNEFRVSLIGAELLHALEGEGFNRYFIFARDPKTGEAVDIQELLPKEGPGKAFDEIDEASVAMSLRAGKPAQRTAEELALARAASRSRAALVPTIAPGAVQGALSGKTIFINQSHGWFDDVAVNRWRVQRGAGHGALEDFDSPEFINLWVLPMLRNAGAKVVTVREPDLQTNMVIKDNGDATGYAETGTWAASTINGFVQKTTPSWTGRTVNPFNQGTGQNRLANVTSGAATATATWTATIPADGYYNVYASWSAFSSRASDAQYLVRHSGGETEVRVDQTIDGYQWNLLGNFYFEAGAQANERQVVLTNSSSDGSATNVSADAVRWGGGMGDVARNSNGVSGRPRWEEEAVIYLQWNGFGYSGLNYTGADDEEGGWADRPQYCGWRHTAANGAVEDGVYFAWHTNAASGTARGLTTYRHSTASAASITLQNVMHDTLYDHVEDLYFPNWTVRAKNVQNFGENNQNSLQNLPGFLYEGLFHDNQTDAEGYNDPKFRKIAARGILDGLLNYFEGRDATTFTRLPETPVNFRAVSLGGGQVMLQWDAGDDSTDNQYYGDEPTGYVVYRSSNGFGFDNGAAVAGTSTTIAGLPENEVTYFRVAATNAGGVSFPSETLAATGGGGNQVLIVNGFDRNERSIVPTETIASAGSDLRRLDPRKFQAFNYVIEHAEALESHNLRISSASNEAVASGAVALATYDAVFWICGEESTSDETLSSAEQALVTSYLALGTCKNLFISGSEIGWDLGRSSQPQADRDFYANTLRAAYVGDSADTYAVVGAGAGPFMGLGSTNFSVGSGARYNAEFADRIDAANGSMVGMTYSGGNGGNAAIYHDGDSKLIMLAFPFECVATAASRNDIMTRALGFFCLGPQEVPDIEIEPTEIHVGPEAPPPPDATVMVTSANLGTNTIAISLSPPEASGSLEVRLDSQVVYSNASVAGGAVNANFGDLTMLPEGQEYQNIVAVWTVNGTPVEGMMPFHIKALGVYRHSQYNIPAESHATCQTGGSTDIYITNASCNFLAETFPETFRSQTALNGRGTSNNYGIAVREVYCINTFPTPPADAELDYTFRRNGTADGACAGVASDTVAVNQNHPDLECGDTVFIVGVGSKTVTDYCAACGPPTRPDYKQLDNFTTDGRCSGIADLGNYATIKVF